ncbi:Sensor histidine kinase TmoS [compost metagenome]
MGIEWSAHPNDDEVRREYEQIGSLLGDRAIEDLIDLPLMKDATSLVTVNALGKLFAPALQTDFNLSCLSICKAISLSLEWGNCDASCVLYANLFRVAGRRFGDYQVGFRFGQLGCELIERRGLTRFEASTYLCFSCFAVRWMRPVAECRELLRRSFAAANRIGDLPYGAYAGNNLTADLLFAGEVLPDVQIEAERGLDYAKTVRFGLVIDFINTQLALIRMLRGLTATFGRLDDGELNEPDTEAHLSSNPDLVLAECLYWVRKLQARYMADDPGAAMAAAAKAQQLLWVCQSFFEEAEFYFYDALARAAWCDSIPADEYGPHLGAMMDSHRQLQTWAQQCPDNFASRAALVGAEIARVEGRVVEAELLYEQAIDMAQNSGFIQIEALANELASRFYAARGLGKIARVYLQDARYGYLRWGADGKVRQLDAKYPSLRTEEHPLGSTTTMATAVEHLDLATVLKVSQALSGEIVLEKLIDTVMFTAIEQAGAERGLLILSTCAEHRIAAQVTTGDNATQLRDIPVSSQVLPESVLYQVLRTRESVVLDDAVTEAAFSTDPYIRQHRARSILCLPLMNQAKLVGALYLENNLAAGVFSPDRIAVLKLVASQAAISLENTRLYREVAERERRYREVQTELSHANRVATMGQLVASIAHEVNQPIAAAILNANAAQRWLNTEPPELDEVRHVLSRLILDANRAADVLGRIRQHIRKAPRQKGPVDINAAIGEMIEFSRSQIMKNGVALQTQLMDGLPLIEGDRVELQQVLLNLIMNALEAMSGTAQGERQLQISVAPGEAGYLRVSVSDSGPGFLVENTDQVFTSFYTTKPTGLGLGLSICRSIIEAHGGRLWASANQPCGATVQFTLPVMQG